MPRKTSKTTPPAKKAKTAALNDKQARFVAEYLIDLNATQAAIRAGYSPKTAYAQGFDLLRKPEVQAEVQKAMEQRAAKTEITAERVLKEIARLAFFDARRLFDDEGRPIPVPQLDDDSARAVVGMDIVAFGNAEVGVGQVQKVKLADKKGALELLGRHMGLFKDTLKISGSVETTTKVIKVPLKQYNAELEAQARAATTTEGVAMTAGAIKVPIKGPWQAK